jgi:hypothetical protein
MDLPKIGEIVTTERARGLCAQFTFGHLVTRIQATPQAFKEWKFDGASMIPDGLVAKLASVPNLTAIALRHDLKYAYGEPGNDQERQDADREFMRELIADGATEEIAEIMYRAVRLFGDPPFKTSFSWGFARK